MKPCTTFLRCLGRRSTVSSLYTSLRKSYLTEWRVWYRMHQLVYSKKWKSECYVDIGICEEWHGEQGFINWFDYMGPRPKNCEIQERLNKFENFQPGNVKWSTLRKMNNNKRWHHTHEERTKYRLIAHSNGISTRCFNSRIYCGWDIQDAATLPIQRNVPYRKRIVE